jgi:2-polyprenyl-3-methyl-5-hydroxy-6-metoxy-1,4-benzoquinol methylase
MTDATFSFGKNWQDYLKTAFSPERVDISKQYILDFLGLDSLAGKYFLDVGSGSGLSSLAALEAGAARVVSFDVDPQSVATTQKLREYKGNPSTWEVYSGSVLDKAFLATLEPADIVYSWGVLHHTGAMWQAIDNTLPLIKPDGLFYLALYTTTELSDYWTTQKQLYNRATPFRKWQMEMIFIAKIIRSEMQMGHNPITHITQYKQSRGMSFMHDVKDWLGGWPYEHASNEAVKTFLAERGYQLDKIRPGISNSEYLFSKVRR